MEIAGKIIVLPVIGPGDQGYIDFKRWIETAFPNLSPAEYTQLCRWAAERMEV